MQHNLFGEKDKYFIIKDPKNLKNLIRSNHHQQFQKDFFIKVYNGLVNCQDIPRALNLCYSLKYAADRGLFDLPKNELKENSLAKILIERIFNLEEEDKIQKILSSDTKQDDSSDITSKMKKVQITLEKQINIDNYNEREQNTSISIKCIQQIIKDEKLNQEEEDQTSLQNGESGYRTNFHIFSTYFKIFQKYLVKSNSQIIHSQIINGDIYKGLTWKVGDKKLSMACQFMLDNIMLKCLCIQIVCNQINIHSCLVDDKIFKALLEIIISSTEECKKSRQLISLQKLSFHIPSNYCLKYYIKQGVYSKFEGNKLADCIQKKYKIIKQKYKQDKTRQYYYQVIFEKVDVFYQQLYIFLDKIRLKTAQTVSRIVGMKKDKLLQLINDSTLQKLQGLQTELKSELWYIFTLFSKPLQDQNLFKNQYQASLLISSDFKIKKDAKRARDYILAILANQKLANQYFKWEVIEEMVKRISNDQQLWSTETLNAYLSVIIKTYYNLQELLIQIITKNYLSEISNSKQKKIQNLLLKIVQISTIEPNLGIFFSKFVNIQLKECEVQKMGFWLVLVQILFSRFQLNICIQIQKYIEYWKMCIVSTSALENYSSSSLQLSYEKVQQKENINYSFLTSQILKQHKTQVPIELIVYYLQKYESLNPLARSNSLEIINQIDGKIGDHKSKIAQNLEKILQLIQIQKDFARNIKLKDIFYILYAKVKDQQLKKKYYFIVIDFIGFHQPRLQSNKQRLLNLCSKILSLIPSQKTNNQGYQLSIIGKILQHQAMKNLHRQAFNKSCSKLKLQVQAPSNLIGILQGYLQKQLPNGTLNIRNQLKAIFSLPTPLSKPFIRFCFSYFRNSNPQQFNQFMQIILKHSLQQLQNPLFNLVQQRQIAKRQKKKSDQALMQQIELISQKMVLLDEFYVTLVFDLSKIIFSTNKEVIIWKILELAVQAKDTNLSKIIQEKINQVVKYQFKEFNGRFYNFLTSKSQLIQKLSSKTIQYTLKSFKQNNTPSFAYLVAEILLKNPHTAYNFSQLCIKFGQFINESKSNQFTRALTQVFKIKIKGHSIFLQKKIQSQLNQLIVFLKKAFYIQRLQSLISCIDLFEIIWQYIPNCGQFYQILLTMLIKFSKNYIIKQKYKSLMQNKINHKNTQYQYIWQQINFELLDQHKKKQLATEKISKKAQNPGLYLRYFITLFQNSIFSSQQLSKFIQDLKKIKTADSTIMNLLIQKLLKYQIIHLIKDQKQIHVVLNFIGFTVLKLKNIKKNQPLCNLYQRFLVKCCTMSTHILNSLPQQLYSFLGPLTPFQAQQYFNKRIEIIEKINSINQFVTKYSFMLINPSQKIIQLLSGLLLDIRCSIQQLPMQLVQKFVEKILSIPFLDKSHNDLIFLTAFLLQRGSKNHYLLAHYLLHSTLYQVSSKFNQQILLKSLLKYCCQQTLTIASQIIKRYCKDKDTLSSENILLLNTLNSLTQNKQIKISNLAWKCILSICSNNSQAYQKFLPYIMQLKEQVQNKLGKDINNLIILSNCTYLPKCQTITQILLMNFMKKLTGNAFYKKFSEYQLEEAFKNLRLKSDFLIVRERNEMQQLLNQNQYFIKNLQKLFVRKYLIPDDVVFILEYAYQYDFYQTAEELALYGQKIIKLIIQRRLQQKNIFLLNTITFWNYFSFRNCFNFVQAITNIKDLEQMEKLSQFIKGYPQIYDKSFFTQSFQKLKKSLLIESLISQFTLQSDKQKLRIVFQRFMNKAIKSSNFFQQLLKKIEQIINHESIKLDFIDSLQTFCDYVGENNEISIKNLDLLTKTPRIINQQFVKSVGSSHDKDIHEIINELKLSLSNQEINGLEQFLRKFQQISELQYNIQKNQENIITNVWSQKRQQNEEDSIAKKLQIMSKVYKECKKKLKFTQSEFFDNRNFKLISEIVYYDRKVKSCKGIKKTLRNTQKVAIWMALNSVLKNSKSNILQVSTGEGKSLIIVGVAAILARQGFNVDIITSSPVLASRDSQEFKKLFQIMTIKNDCNIQKIPYQSGQKSCYKSQVVYGTCNQFSFDWLRHNYSRLNTKGSRDEKKSYLIIDQADSCMLDDMFYVARLSDSFPGSQCLLPLYFHIWNNFRQLIKRLIKIEDKLYSVKGQINISQEDDTISITYINDVQKGTVFIPDLKKQIIKCINEGTKVNQLPFVLGEINASQHLDFVKTQMQTNIRQMLKMKQFEFIWSNYAKKYAEGRVKTWAESLMIAEKMTQNVDYIVTKSKTIKLVDYLKTGVVQNNTSLSNAVHQFLQCKHKCPLTLQTRTTNYLSFYSYFQMYKNRIIGLTGTVGGTQSTSILSKAYDLNCYVIPKFQKDMMYKLPSIQFTDSQQWIKKIIESAILQTKKGKAVLIVCLTIKIGIKITKELQRKYDKGLITAYFSNDSLGQGGNDQPKQCRPNEIIVATNLAGRGTDIKTVESVQTCGGLHIILTYIPVSERVEMQIMGRTCRNGKLGTFQRIALVKQQENINENSNQETRYQEIIEEINIKDKLFQQYNKFLINVRNDQSLNIYKRQFVYKRTLAQIVINQIQDRFSQLLTSIEKMFEEKKVISDIKKKIKQELKQIINAYSLYMNNPKFEENNFFRNGCYMMRLANSYLQSRSQQFQITENPQKLKEILDYTQKRDPNNFNVYYLKAYYYIRGKKCVIFKNEHDKNYKQESLNLLMQSKVLLLNQMSGYESVTQFLIRIGQQNGKMYKQFQKKLEICAQCLQSIDRIENVIIRSDYPLCVKIFFVKQKQKIQQVHYRINRKQAQKIINRANNGIQIKCLKVNSIILSRLVKQTNRNIHLYLQGQINQLISSIQSITKDKDSIQFKAAKIKILNIPASIITTLNSSIWNFSKNKPIKIFNMQLQLSEKALQDQGIKYLKSLRKYQSFTRVAIKDQGFQQIKQVRKQFQIFIVPIENQDFFPEISKYLRQGSVVTVFLHQIYHIENIKQILQFYSKGAHSCSVQIQDQGFDNEDRIKFYQKHFDSSGLQLEAVIYCQSIEEGKNTLKILDKEIQKAEQTIQIGKEKKLSELYPQMDSPVVQIAQMYNRGFQLIFQAQYRKQFPYEAVIFLTAVAAAQIALGAGLMITGVGFAVGTSILTESINEVVGILDVCRTNQFSIQSYLIGKAVSVALSAFTFGFNGLRNAAKGVTQVMEVAVKQGVKLCQKTGKQVLSSIGKNLLLQIGQQGAKKIAKQGLQLLSDTILQKFQSNVEIEVENALTNLQGQTMQQLKRLKYLESIQVGIGKTSHLKTKISQAFMPKYKCPYISQIISGIKLIATQFIKKKMNCGTYLDLAVQITEITSALTLLKSPIQQQIVRMKNLLVNKISYIPYPRQAVIKYLQIKKIAQQQMNLIVKQIDQSNRQKKQQEIQQIQRASSNFSELVLKEFVNIDLQITTKQNNKKFFTIRLNQILKYDLQQVIEWDFQMIKKILVDFVLAQLKKNINQKIVKPILAPILNKRLIAPLTKRMINKLLTNKQQHSDQDKRRYQLIKNKDNKTYHEKEFINFFENPTIKYQQAHCNYKSKKLAQVHSSKINIKGDRIIAQQQLLKISELLINLQNHNYQKLDMIDLKQIASMLDLKIKLTSNPDQKLSKKQIADDVKLILYKQENNKGLNYEIFDTNTNNFHPAKERSLSSSGVDVIRQAANQVGHNILDNKSLGKIISQKIKQDISLFVRQKEAYQFLSVKFPKQAKTLINFDKFPIRQLEKAIQQFYPYGKIIGHGYNSQIFKHNLIIKYLQKFNRVPLHQFITFLERQNKNKQGNTYFAFPDEFSQMNQCEKHLFIEKQLKNIYQICQFEKLDFQLEKKVYCDVNHIQYQKYQHLCRNTYNVCCRHQNVAIDFLFKKDPNFSKFMKAGNRISFVRSQGHIYMVMTVYNTKNQFNGISYVFDGTMSVKLSYFQRSFIGRFFEPQKITQINRQIERLYSGSKNCSTDIEFIQYFQKQTEIAQRQIKKIVSSSQGNRSQMAFQLGYMKYRSSYQHVRMKQITSDYIYSK